MVERLRVPGDSLLGQLVEHVVAERRGKTTHAFERLDPPKRLLRLAVETGCRVAIDTDAHAPGQLDWQMLGCERAATCGVPAASVINTMTAGDLVAWTRRGQPD